jgi:hypothetical protein
LSSSTRVEARPHQLASAGVQYYVAGRFAFRCGYHPVAGALFHQGFELIFKAPLLQALEAQHSPGNLPTRTAAQNRAAVETYTAAAKELLHRQVWHHLFDRAWPAFKALHPTAGLSGLDNTVAELDRWWRLRYPGFPTGQAVSMTFSVVGGSPPRGRSPADDEYHLELKAMDELFEAVIGLDWNPAAVEQWMRGVGAENPRPGIAAYEWENHHRIK